MGRAGAIGAVVVVLLTAAAQAHAAPRTGDWWGEGASMAVDFRVERWSSGPVVLSFITETKRGCNPRAAKIITAGTRVRRGRFSIREEGLNGLIDRRVTGRFTSAGRIKGTYREIDRTFGRNCDTGTLRWTARRVRRQPVRNGTWNSPAGDTTATFRVQKGRLMDKISGDAPSCTREGTGGYRGPAEWFLIRPNGSFSIDLAGPAEGGFFAGRFSDARSASGTVRAIYVSQGGEPTCESGVQTWSATSG